jgi:glycosyltransferase involved in cell wall biosynthesis
LNNKLHVLGNAKFIIYVGTEKVSKNLETLFRAFSLCRHNVENLKLIKVGPPRRRQYLLKLAKELGIHKDVIWLDHVTDQELCYLYNISSALVIPSIAEGFSVPLIEAMACGTPVIASNRAACPEVVEDAGLLFDPYDENELSEKILKILYDEKLKSTLKKKGLERSRLFDPEIIAEEWLNTYGQL